MNITNILIIEDDVDQMEILKWNIQNHGYKVIGCLDSIDGISKFVRNRPDLILLDLNLPFLDGENVIESLERNEILNNTPTIIISGEPDVRIENAVKRIDPIKVFRKPFEYIELIDYINELNKQ